MTAERINRIEHQVDAEELVALLAAPVKKSVEQITDPIALCGLIRVDHDPLQATLVAAAPDH